MKTRCRIAVAIVVAGPLQTAAAAPASTYEIGSGSLVKKTYDLHESFTAVAAECLAAAAGEPRDCGPRLADAIARARQQRGRPGTTDPYASRWPDDPTRMLDGDVGQARFGAQLSSACRAALRGGSALDAVGLLCSSHFGRLQFLHSQATPDDGDDAALTRRKVLAWAEFAFRAATEPAYRATNYCEAVDGLPEPALRDALSFRDPRFCSDRKRRVLGIVIGTYRAWTVSTLFSLQCSNPVQEKSCWQRVGDRGEETAIAAARGAVLHLVQDSFSQSHAARVADGATPPGPRGPFRAMVVCRPVRVFYEYGAQHAETPDAQGVVADDPHAEGDQPPQPDASCTAGVRPVDDVITASAMALYYLDRRDLAGFNAYMARRVFPG